MTSCTSASLSHSCSYPMPISPCEDSAINRWSYGAWPTTTPSTVTAQSSAGTWEAAYWSAQVALTAANLVQGGERAAYALCRPPGHHASIDQYGGYCYLNNAAIAARWLQGKNASRVAIVNIDTHHGNGTQEIFYAGPRPCSPARCMPILRSSIHTTGAAAKRLALAPGSGTIGIGRFRLVRMTKTTWLLWTRRWIASGLLRRRCWSSQPAST